MTTYSGRFRFRWNPGNKSCDGVLKLRSLFIHFSCFIIFLEKVSKRLLCACMISYGVQTWCCASDDDPQPDDHRGSQQLQFRPTDSQILDKCISGCFVINEHWKNRCANLHAVRAVCFRRSTMAVSHFRPIHFFHVSSILFYPKNILALFCHCNKILTNTFSFFCYNVVTSKCRKLGGYPDTCRAEIGRFQSQKQTPRVRRVGRRLNYRAVCFHGDHFHSNDSKTIGKKWKTRGNRLRKRMARQLSLRPQTIFNVQKAKIENCLIVYVESQRLKYLTYFGVQFSCNASTFT